MAGPFARLRSIAQIEGLQYAFDLCVRMAAARQNPYTRQRCNDA